MRQTSAPGIPPWLKAGYASNSKPQPPDPRPYKPLPPSERVMKQAGAPVEVTKPQRRNLIRRSFSTRDEQQLRMNEPRNIARGLEASQRVVREGILDSRYRPAARRVTAIICALPIAIYLSYELYERRFRGKAQKVRPTNLAGSDGGAT